MNYTWFRIDVQGDLQPIVAKARGQVAFIYAYHNEDLFVSSQREGIHGTITLHPDGWAFDIYPPKGDWDAVPTIKAALGKDFDVINEGNHIHVEYDPKGTNHV